MGLINVLLYGFRPMLLLEYNMLYLLLGDMHSLFLLPQPRIRRHEELLYFVVGILVWG